MIKEIQSFSVSKSDPFFTADKWNETLNYSQCFEKMINKLLGEKFKGIYKPFLDYELYDYVWFNNDYYQITDTKSNSTKIINKENYSNAYYYNSNYIALNPNKKIVHIIGQNEYELSSTQFNKFYLYEDEIIALSEEQNLYKIDIKNKTTTPINYIFAREIKEVKKDKFQIYILSNNMIEVGNSLSNDFTETKELYTSDIDITDIAIAESYLFVLKENNQVDIINKATGKLISSFNISQEINHEKSKIVCSDSYSLIIYDGISQLLMFFSSNDEFLYSGNSENEYLRYGIDSLTYNENYIVATNNSVFLIYLASRYNLDQVKPSSFMTYNMLIDKNKNIEEYLDFSKGNFETETLVPEYTKINFCNNIGPIISSEPFLYRYNKFLNKTIKVKMYASSPINETIFNIYVGNKKVSVELNAIESGDYTFYIDIENDKYKIAYYSDNERIIKDSNYSIVSDKENLIEFAIKDKTYFLKELIIFDRIIDFNQKDYFYNNKIGSFELQASTKSYPFSYVKTDENGNINLNIQDNSILKNENGFKVNLSSDTSKSDTDIGFNLKGAKQLWDKVVNKLTEMNNSLAPLKHRHKWKELDEIPEATTTQPGIVQLSSSTSGSSETIAATEKAVKETYDKANHSHPYLNVTTGGEVLDKTVFKEIEVNNLKVADKKINFDKEIIIIDENNFKFVAGDTPSSIKGISSGYINDSGSYIEGAVISSSGDIKGNSINAKKVLIDGYTITIG